MPPNPREPEASVYRDKTSEVTQWEGIKNPAPFQLHIKSSHILRSLKKPWLNLIRWWGKETFLVSWIIRCRNGRPGGITLQAKFKEPIRDCSSLSVPDLLPLNSVKHDVRRWTLSGERRASMRSESRTIPMNSRVVGGPCVSWGAMGIPRSLKVSNMLDKLCWQAKLWGAIGDGVQKRENHLKCGKQKRCHSDWEEATQLLLRAD